jgi:protein-S-isoprenylcysteine O-methyltransferase Ste14
LGMSVAYSGIFIFLQNPWFVPILPLLIWLLTILVVVPEEKHLEGKFNQQYLDFKARIRRWI